MLTFFMCIIFQWYNAINALYVYYVLVMDMDLRYALWGPTILHPFTISSHVIL